MMQQLATKSHLQNEILIFDEINGILKNMFHFLIKCGFALKIVNFFDKITIFHQIRLIIASKCTEVQD